MQDILSHVYATVYISKLENYTLVLNNDTSKPFHRTKHKMKLSTAAFFTLASTASAIDCTTKWYNDAKGFGFCTANGHDYFVDIGSFVNRLETFKVEEGTCLHGDTKLDPESPKGPSLIDITLC